MPHIREITASHMEDLFLLGKSCIWSVRLYGQPVGTNLAGADETINGAVEQMKDFLPMLQQWTRLFLAHPGLGVPTISFDRDPVPR